MVVSRNRSTPQVVMFSPWSPDGETTADARRLQFLVDQVDHSAGSAGSVLTTPTSSATTLVVTSPEHRTSGGFGAGHLPRCY